MDVDKTIWKDKKVLITGHTGFKGTWLTMLLWDFGAKVYGVSLPPEGERNLYRESRVSELMEGEYFADIRNFEEINEVMNQVEPDFIFHLAAQAIVRRSVRDPLETFSTNIMGSANIVLSAVKRKSLLGIVVATTDKVYENSPNSGPFKESDKLGGNEAYSSSKACVEIIINSIRTSNNPFNIPISTVRAGNVLGGGDWGESRLFPDLAIAAQGELEVRVRFPNATRPWQYVLDCLLGYLFLAQIQIHTPLIAPPAVNIGPKSSLRVQELIQIFESEYGTDLKKVIEESEINEHASLQLESNLARSILGWQNLYEPLEAISLATKWYADYFRGIDPRYLMIREIRGYWEKC
jgi:CDP-glucose 4,6-dehydratase